jgi:hypothetical protein
MAIDLFSYCESWANKDYQKQLYRHVRTTYLLRSILLLPFLPFDIIYVMVRSLFCGRMKADYLFCSIKAYKQFRSIPDFLEKKVIVVTDPLSAINQLDSNCTYFPASLIYFMCGMLPWKGPLRKISHNIIVKFSSGILKLTMIKKKFILICHSDSLPFARAVIFAGKTYGAISVCVQHGIFHEHYEVSELDGVIADINIVRSTHDKNLIKKNNRYSKYLVTPDFFKVLINNANDIGVMPIILVGEGLHVVNRELAEKYIARLKEIESELLGLGIYVEYRPHPSERFRYRFFGFKAIDRRSLEKSFGIARGYIGYSSTLMVEASAIGIPCYSVELPDIYIANLNRDANSIETIYKYNSEALISHEFKKFSVDSTIKRLNAQQTMIIRELEKTLND